MSIKTNYLIKNFKNDGKININLIYENKFIFYIKKFFYQIITLGLKRSLYEAKSEDKKELFNIAFSVYASLPQSFLKINEIIQEICISLLIKNIKFINLDTKFTLVN
ncbi:hypothetical protein [Candidatus Williamhamiltonella defendens]|uniref:Uncharacterized protein n=1 Tax=Candidatus Hamiltonella defensa (Bemisia tabaci) TaxID=672795 RepID=A0A249DZ71_9ENTR|nr:hypothetical protein [Candidatus Hamiltonella defensa]ASX26721.1 hypothetical protein BA171_06755 [Candidatus Hamiltonella defensa (Bemisia tabaci)]